MKTFGVYIIRNLLEHPIGDYENTWESSFWKFSVFEENWGYHENVGFWRLKKCSRKKYISKLLTAWVFERFKEILIFLSNFFVWQCLKTPLNPEKFFLKTAIWKIQRIEKMAFVFQGSVKKKELSVWVCGEKTSCCNGRDFFFQKRQLEIYQKLTYFWKKIGPSV